MTGTEAGQTLAAIRWNKPLPEASGTGLGPIGVVAVAAGALAIGAVAGWVAQRRAQNAEPEVDPTAEAETAQED
jgi:hypothetical protein